MDTMIPTPALFSDATVPEDFLGGQSAERTDLFECIDEATRKRLLSSEDVEGLRQLVSDRALRAVGFATEEEFETVATRIFGNLDIYFLLHIEYVKREIPKLLPTTQQVFFLAFVHSMRGEDREIGDVDDFLAERYDSGTLGLRRLA